MPFNKHIEEYLDYYVAIPKSPNFAIMIRGKWGSGKSWFIKKYKERKQTGQKIKYFYVSLYGITSYAEIEDAFFKEMNPVFASEGMKVAGAILKGVLKSTIKIDFDAIGDPKTDGSVTGTIPTIPTKLLKSFKELKNCVLIFDDLERCSLPILNILGYINQFVENDDLKAIILANEEEIIQTDNQMSDSRNDKPYLLIKEKLIGKTFEIDTDIDEAISDFISQLQNENVQKIFQENTSIIKELFNRANYNNLRHLRQSILDFERFYQYVPISALTNHDLLKNVLQTFFSISFEIKKGILKIENIQDLFKGALIRKRADEDPIKKIHLKYPVFNQFNTAIDPQNWTDYFKKGTTSSEDVKTSIYNSIYFQDERTPSWKKLSNFYYLTQLEFDRLFQLVNSDLHNIRIQNLNELIEVVALFLHFSKIQIIPIAHNDIVESARKNLINLKEIGILKKAAGKPYSLGYNRQVDSEIYEMDEFKAFFNMINIEIASYRTEILNQAASDLLDSLKGSAQDFDEKLLIDRYGVSHYSDIPILSYISIPDFVSVFWELSPTDRYTLGFTLKDRYKYDEFNPKLVNELSWLNIIKGTISNENKKRNEKLTEYLVETRFLESLKLAIETLEKGLTSNEGLKE